MIEPLSGRHVRTETKATFPEFESDVSCQKNPTVEYIKSNDSRATDFGPEIRQPTPSVALC
jgi:hypothetical protein